MKAIIRPLLLNLSALRLSPLRVMLFGCLGAWVGFAAAFAIRSIDQPVAIATEPLQRSDWRSPTLAASAPMRSKLPGADVETLKRPVFAKTRRPAPSAAPQADAGAQPMEDNAPPLGLTLVAITKFSGVARVFIVSTSTPQGKWIDSGEQIEGWTVEGVQGSELTLKSGSRSVRLRLYSGSDKS